ncbi:PRD domain-containing protein, partial [Lacticaseibacillus paracasei]
ATPAAAGKANILEVTQLVDNVLQAVRALTGGTIDTTSLNYERFVTHMKFFAERYLGDTMLADDGQLLTSVYTVYPEAAKIALKVQKAIIAIYDKEPTKEELAYLIIHIHRVLTN